MSKPVTIRFVGDESKFRATTEAVGGRLRDFGKQAEREGDRAGKGLDRFGEGADVADTRAMGFRDTLTGVQDTLKGTAMLAKGPSFEGFLTLGMGIGDLGSGLFNFVVPALKAFSVQAILAKVNAIASAVATKAAAVASKAWAVAQWALNAAMTANPIGIVIAIIAALVAGIVIAYQRSETFRRIVQTVWGAVKQAVGVAVDGIKAALSWFAGLPGRMRGWFEAAKAGAVDRLQALIAWVKGLPGRIVAALGNLGRLLLDKGKDIVRGLWEGIKSMAKWITDKILGWISSVIPEPIKRFLGLASPSKLMIEMGRSTAEGLAVGLDVSRRRVAGAARGLAAVAAAGTRLELAGAGGRGLRGGNVFNFTLNPTRNATAAEIAREMAWDLKTAGY